MKTNAVSSNAEVLRTNEKKWTKPLMQTGWIAIPNIIVMVQQTLGLKPIDVNILLHLARYWWLAEVMPHPAKSTIARAIGVHPSTVQRRIAHMERKGLIKRIYRPSESRGNLTNEYDFSGLIQKATPHAEAHLAERAKRARADAAAERRGGRPKLEVVS